MGTLKIVTDHHAFEPTPTKAHSIDSDNDSPFPFGGYIHLLVFNDKTPCSYIIASHFNPASRSVPSVTRTCGVVSNSQIPNDSNPWVELTLENRLANSNFYALNSVLDMLSSTPTNKKEDVSFQGSDLQREARMSAIQAIRSISNWLYWQSPIAGGSTRQTSQKLKRIPQNSSEPNVKKLRAAAAARKQAQENPKPIHQIPSKYVNNDEYWTPSRLVLPNTTQSKSGSRTTLESSPKKELNQTNNNDFVTKNARQSNPLVWGVPMGMATIAAIIVRSQVGEGVASGGLKEHMGGSLALDIVNSSWLQFILAAVPWYVIGLVVVGLIQGIRSKLNMYEE